MTAAAIRIIITLPYFLVATHIPKYRGDAFANVFRMVIEASFFAAAAFVPVHNGDAVRFAVPPRAKTPPDRARDVIHVTDRANGAAVMRDILSMGLYVRGAVLRGCGCTCPDGMAWRATVLAFVFVTKATCNRVPVPRTPVSRCACALCWGFEGWQLHCSCGFPRCSRWTWSIGVSAVRWPCVHRFGGACFTHLFTGSTVGLFLIIVLGESINGISINVNKFPAPFCACCALLQAGSTVYVELTRGVLHRLLLGLRILHGVQHQGKARVE